MNNAPSFESSLLPIQIAKTDPNIWEKVLALYDVKNYQEAFITLFDYIDKNILKTRTNNDKTEFIIPHGSTTVQISLKNGIFSVKAPFLKIPEKNKIAIFRQISEINFKRLVLSQIILKNDELWFEFSCPLEMCEPYKIYSVYEEICLNCDYYDDFFIEKFGASHFEEKKVKYFSKEDLEKAWEKYQKSIDEAFEYYNYFESKRLYGFCWDILNICLMKIDFCMAPQGYLRCEIERIVSAMNQNETSPLNEILDKAKNEIMKLKNLSREKFEASLYIPNVFISAKRGCEMNCVQNMLKKRAESAKMEMGANDFMGATLSMLFAIYNIYFRNFIPEHITKKFNKALEAAGQKTWKEAAEILWKPLHEVLEMKTEEK